MTTTVHVNRRLASGGTYRLGTAAKNEAGWRFLPAVSGRKTSTKAHETWEECLPRWVGYPDGCETEMRPDEAQHDRFMAKVRA